MMLIFSHHLLRKFIVPITFTYIIVKKRRINELNLLCLLVHVHVCVSHT